MYNPLRKEAIIFLYTLKIRLCPSPAQTEQLLKTMERFNAALNVISRIAFENKMFVRAVGRAVEFYWRDRFRTFEPHGAIVYDDRIFVPMSVCEYHSRIINNALRVRGQADLGYIDGKFYSGAKVKNLRRRNFKLRQKLQAKGTKSDKRLLKKRRRKESRFATDVNQCISKKLIQVAKGTKCYRPRRPQRDSRTGKEKHTENGLQNYVTSSVLVEFLSTAPIHRVQRKSGGCATRLCRSAQYVANLL